MNKFKITEINAILIFLIINFIAIGVMIGVQNYYFQIADIQRTEQSKLSEAIYTVLNHTNTDNKQIHERQLEIVNNQKYILKQLGVLSNNSLEDQIEDHVITRMLQTHLSAMNETKR